MAPKTNNEKSYYEDSLALHMSGRPGKLEIRPTKPLSSQYDLSLAYSPGVAAPCLKIEENPDTAYDYTARGNTVAVISNGTAVLGLGNLGALASKPVMEGKAVLFKRFADIDGIDLEVDSEDVDAFVNCVKLLGPSFGGINLEDIKSPDCFIIEQRLREVMDIPVFHDDQHGTAIIAIAGFINAMELTGRQAKDTRVVFSGAGAAAIACVELLKAIGVPRDNIIMCDQHGTIYEGRENAMNQWKSAHAVKTDCRTLADAMQGADAVFGLSVAGAIAPEMIKSMADNPIVFAMANPEPEIKPEDVLAVRKDAIMATGRSDYPNQVNNVLGFPYIFRGALDVRATTINEDMKIAAAHALAELAREAVPDEVDRAYGRRLKYGPEYIIPAPFDPRLIVAIPKAVAKAAMDSGVAKKAIVDMELYEQQLAQRLNPTMSRFQSIYDRVKEHPKRVVFAEGEEEKIIRSAAAFSQGGYGTPVLVGNYEKITTVMQHLGINPDGIEIINSDTDPEKTQSYTNFLYEKQRRKGMLQRDCSRMMLTDRNVFSATMVASGDADAMVTGLTRSFSVAYGDIRKVLNSRPTHRMFCWSMVMQKGRTIFLSDTSIHERPNAEQLADIAEQTATVAQNFGHQPRVAFLSFSNFGNPMRDSTKAVRDAVKILDEKQVDFEYEGEMQADIALDFEQMQSRYPFSRLTAPANVLIMPGLHAANISTKLLRQVDRDMVIGPMLFGCEKPVQIVPMDATMPQIIRAAVVGAYQSVKWG